MKEKYHYVKFETKNEQFQSRTISVSITPCPYTVPVKGSDPILVGSTLCVKCQYCLYIQNHKKYVKCSHPQERS